MAIEITIPRLGWSMDEGIFGEWLKRDGDFVKAGEPIFTFGSEKALQEIESVDEGILRIAPGGPNEGDTVTVGTLVGFLVREGEAIPQVASPGANRDAAQTRVADESPSDPVPSSEVAAKQASATSTAQEASGGPLRNARSGLPAISPRAARAARDLGVDWQNVAGTGRNGRIRERDIRAAAATEQRRPTARRAAGTVRQVIAERMMHSVRTTAPVTLTTRADATNLVSLRRQFKASGSEAVVPAYHDIVLKIVAAALKQHPNMAARWTDEGIASAVGIHIGIAVDSDAGLLAPVVRDVDRLSLRDVAVRSRELVERALSRRSTADELQGGVFTVSNLGAFGVETFTPIINAPESAILGLGAIRREAVVLAGDQIAARDTLPLSLTFDHRVTDGAPAARFLQTVRQGLENPSAWLIG